MTRIEISIPAWQIEGYTPKTTFWQDFSIAERFGLPAVYDTTENALKYCESKDGEVNVEYITELALVLNHKLYQWYSENHESKLAKAYNDLWQAVDNWCVSNLKDGDADYYFKTTD